VPVHHDCRFIVQGSSVGSRRTGVVSVRRLLWVVFLAAFGWVAYVVGLAGWNYYETQAMIDKVLHEEAPSYRAARAAGTADALDRLARNVRNAVVLAASREGLPIRESDIDVSLYTAGLSIGVRWSYPIISYGGNDLLVIPISVRHSLIPPP
jgi:hypothetical protein